VTAVAVRRALLAGASGPIGRALAARLSRQGISVARLVRRASTAPDEFPWDPARGQIDMRAFDGVDAVFNLSGRTLARWPWTESARKEILESRVRATRLLVDSIISASSRPAVLVSGSAMGIYGDRGEEILTETSSAGQGFLAAVAGAWEREAMRAADAGVRVACSRTGLVLSARGGALGPLLLIFRLGLGGRLGDGRQWWSWIHIDDVAGALVAMAEDPDLHGPVNVVGPAPARNADFVRALAGVVRRPALIPAPAFALKLVLGRMAAELLLTSARIVPEQLQRIGFAFAWPELGAALRDVVAGRR
jgi:uncharacterized protein (TIGR01777 family)